MDDELTSTTFMEGKAVTVKESMSNREKAAAIAHSAVVVEWKANGYPYAVVEIPVLVDQIEYWLDQH